jgi:hypothetical protein
MSLWAMCFHTMKNCGTNWGPIHVFLMRDGFNVCRIDTSWCSTEMIQFKANWNISNEQFVRYTMRPLLFAFMVATTVAITFDVTSP